VGGIDFLNSQPLLLALPAELGAEVEITNHLPSELARLLRTGALDVALVPVVEYFIGPPDYRIIPGICIASYGAVESIPLHYRRPLQEVKEVGLDSSSMTSSLLTRLLFTETWAAGKPGPRFTSISPQEARSALLADESGYDAIFLIGDEALEAQSRPEWERVDLATEWTRLTGLPLVYALWIYRGPPIPGMVEAFLRSRDIGRARIDEIVETGPLPAGMSPAAARRYLHQLIRHELGPVEIEGLLEFRCRIRARGLLEIPGPEELRFVDAGERRP